MNIEFKILHSRVRKAVYRVTVFIALVDLHHDLPVRDLYGFPESV